MIDKYIKRMKQLSFMLLLIGSFCVAVSLERGSLIEDLRKVEENTFAYILMNSQLGGETHVDEFDDDFLHIRTPGDDDFLKSGTIPEALLGKDLFFGGVISFDGGATQYRFRNGLTARLDDGVVRTYYPPDAEEIGLRLENGFLRIDPKGHDRGVDVSVNEERGELVLTRFEVWRADFPDVAYAFWISDGYFHQQYGGGDEEKFLATRLVSDDYYSSSDIALQVNSLVERWIDPVGDPHNQYIGLRKFAGQQKFSVPVLGIEGDVSILQQVVCLIIFPITIILLHSSLGFYILSENCVSNEPWIVLRIPASGHFFTFLTISLSAVGFLFFLVSVLFSVLGVLELKKTFDIQPFLSVADTTIFVYISIPLLILSIMLSLTGALRQSKL